MPGPNIIGIAVCIGTKLRGVRGAFAAIGGFLLIPWTLGFALGVVVLQHSDMTVIWDGLAELSAAAAGLLIATGVRMLTAHRHRPAALIFAGLACALIIIAKLPLLAVLLGSVPLSIATAGIEGARAR